jgi:hypothetical protein
MSLVLHPTDVAQWHALISEAEATSPHRLDETQQSYLVFTLMRFCGRPRFVERVMALDYLHALVAGNSAQCDQLRDVGDQCLLFSGLFPEIAERRMVRVSYFVNLGRSAYDQLSLRAGLQGESLYTHLARSFIAIVEVLHAVRALGGSPALTVPQAAELWADTGSRSALQRLADEGVTPLMSDPASKRRQ